MLPTQKKMCSTTGEMSTQNQCRLCLRLANEICSLTNRLEDMRTVRDVMKMMLAIEDDPCLPQQICAKCSKELLHMARLKDAWVANQFVLARQAAKVVGAAGVEQSECIDEDMVQFQTGDATEEDQLVVEVDENVSDSELFPNKTDLGEYVTEETFQIPEEEESNQGNELIIGIKKKKYYKYVRKCGDEKFRCNKCRISFPTALSKDEHIRLHNKCEECGATFMMKNDLRRHMRKHSGERPHGCPHCFQRFVRKVHLQEHLKKHAFLRPYPCLLCTKNFATEEDLMEHKNEVHANTPRRTQRQQATKEKRLPMNNDAVPGLPGVLGKNIHHHEECNVPFPLVEILKEEIVNEDYELIID